MSLSVLAAASGPALDYRRARALTARQRALAWTAVVAVHMAAVGGLALASLQTKAEPPVPTIMVSMISDAPATAQAQPEAASPPPPVPVEPAPQPKMLAAPRPTASPMIAPPPEAPPKPAPAQPSSPSSAAASTASSATSAAPGPSAPSAGPASITPPNFRAAYLNNPAPQYPYGSRRKREQGVVKLKVHVNAAGRAEQVQLEKSSGHAALDEAALEVVKGRWRFVPAKQADKAVAAWVVVPLEFSLKDR